MKKFLSLFMVLAIILCWQGCSLFGTGESLPGGIYGVVTDKATGEPIRSAGVELSPTGMKTITGSEGQFEFTELTPGQYTLLITKTGYTDFASSSIEVKAGATAKTDVQLEQLPPALRVVNDSREDISTLDFGSAEADLARSFNIFNDGVETLEWEIIKTADWIKEISKTSGTLKAGATQAIIITIDRTKLKSGENKTTVHITSNNGSKQLTVIATNGTVYTTLNTLPVTNIKTTGATLNGEILLEGNPKYIERGFVYSTSGMPTIETTIKKMTVPVTNDKKFSVAISGLTMGTTYYVRAYAKNADQVSYSSNEVPFTPAQSLPQVTTEAATNISVSTGTATFNGTIVELGDPAYTERGFVYGLQHNPTIEDDTKKVVSGKSLGGYSTNVSGLAYGTTYYIRAYATNAMGTAYGTEQKLETVLSEYQQAICTEYAGYTYKCYPFGSMNWTQAKQACADFDLGGYTDWYLPNKEEMMHILENTTLDSQHQNVWWTSTLVSSYYGTYYSIWWDKNAIEWYVNSGSNKSNSHYVCAVRKYKE